MLRVIVRALHALVMHRLSALLVRRATRVLTWARMAVHRSVSLCVFKCSHIVLLNTYNQTAPTFHITLLLSGLHDWFVAVSEYSRANQHLLLYFTKCYRRVPKFWTHGSVCCACAQRPGLPRACHSGLLACLALQAVVSAHVAFAARARLFQSFSRTLRSRKTLYCFRWVQTSVRYLGSTCVPVQAPLCVMV